MHREERTLIGRNSQYRMVAPQTEGTVSWLLTRGEVTTFTPLSRLFHRCGQRRLQSRRYFDYKLKTHQVALTVLWRTAGS